MKTTRIIICRVRNHTGALCSVMQTSFIINSRWRKLLYWRWSTLHCPQEEETDCWKTWSWEDALPQQDINKLPVPSSGTFRHLDTPAESERLEYFCTCVWISEILIMTLIMLSSKFKRYWKQNMQPWNEQECQSCFLHTSNLFSSPPNFHHFQCY